MSYVRMMFRHYVGLLGIFVNVYERDVFGVVMDGDLGDCCLMVECLCT